MRNLTSRFSFIGSRGFTLAELLVAMMVTSIILTAVVTLAYAMGSANDSADDTVRKQAHLRYSTLRISELIRNCRLICASRDNSVAIWRADSNGNRQINANELVYIERGSDKNYLQLLEFPSLSTPVSLSDIQTGAARLTMGASGGQRQTVLIPVCSNVQFGFDVLPPQSGFVSISFNLPENGVLHKYQINASLRAWAGNLLDSDGDAVVSDDD